MKFTRVGKMVCVGLLAVTTAVGSMCMASAATDTSTKLEYFQYGDVDMDGRVSVTDRTLIQKFISNIETPSETQKILADVDGDGAITIKDATEVGKYVTNLSDYNPRVGSPSEIKLTYALYGDVDRDGVISVIDASTIRSYLSGSKELGLLQKLLADVDGDGKVTEDDATYIQDYIAHAYENGIIGTESDIPVLPE